MEKDIKEIVLNASKEGKVVINTIEGPCIVSLEELVGQPVDGLLYDLNRSEEIALAFMDDPKWINDFACAQVIRYLKKEIRRYKRKIMKKWYFTFGMGMRLANTGTSLAYSYVEVEAESYGEAREIMVSWYGTMWAFQYDEERGKEVIEKYAPVKLKTLYEKNPGEIIKVTIG